MAFPPPDPRRPPQGRQQWHAPQPPGRYPGNGHRGTGGPPQRPEPRWLRYVGAVLVPVVIGVATIAWNEHRAPQLQVEGEKAKETARTRELAEDPPLRVRIEDSWDDLDNQWIFRDPLAERDIEAIETAGTDRTSGMTLWDMADDLGGLQFSRRIQPDGCTDRCGASSARFKLRLTGHRDEPVQITEISARILSERTPPREALLDQGTAGSGEIESGVILLDSDRPRLLTYAEDAYGTGKPGGPYFNEKAVSLAMGELLVFDIFGTSSSWNYEWELVLSLIVDGTDEEMVVRSNGTPTGPPFLTPGRIGDPSEYMVHVFCDIGAPCVVDRN
ncbi:hypothetical protein EDD29_4908 [Actinocorallia herbida]|uniref:Uncharacterized protein n=1 Tax=Actinocorallia herbida TaxID=58109 RepID=A0A3N1D1C1_9ACTN|nr:hypothetical protein [Actinocorallia herbida]ROO87311.1 hypothetical protein EDD29_4908 [Actinocorallia herbida]